MSSSSHSSSFEAGYRKLTVVNIGDTSEESRNVLLEYGQRSIQILKNSDNRVLALDSVFRSLQRTDSIEGAEYETNH